MTCYTRRQEHHHACIGFRIELLVSNDSISIDVLQTPSIDSHLRPYMLFMCDIAVFIGAIATGFRIGSFSCFYTSVSLQLAATIPTITVSNRDVM